METATSAVERKAFSIRCTESKSMEMIRLFHILPIFGKININMERIMKKIINPLVKVWKDINCFGS